MMEEDCMHYLPCLWKIALTVCSLILSPFTFVGMLRMPSGDF